MYWANPNDEPNTIVTISCCVRWSPRLRVKRMKKNGKNASGNKSRNDAKPRNGSDAPKPNGGNAKDDELLTNFGEHKSNDVSAKDGELKSNSDTRMRNVNGAPGRLMCQENINRKALTATHYPVR